MQEHEHDDQVHGGGLPPNTYSGNLSEAHPDSVAGHALRAHLSPEEPCPDGRVTLPWNPDPPIPPEFLHFMASGTTATVEIEDDRGQRVSIGEWRQHPDRRWGWVIEDLRPRVITLEAQHAADQKRIAELERIVDLACDAKCGGTSAVTGKRSDICLAHDYSNGSRVQTPCPVAQALAKTTQEG